MSQQTPPPHSGSSASKPAPAPQDGLGFEEEESIHILPIVNLLLINRKAILVPTLWLTLAVALYSLWLTPVYTATATFITTADTGVADKLATGAGQGDGMTSMPEYYTALLHSSSFLGALVKRQKGVDASHPGAWLEELAGNDDDEEKLTLRAVSLLKEMVAIKPIPKGRILEVSVNSHDASLSERIASDVLEAISAQGGDERNQKALADRDFISKRLMESEQNLREAETALSAFLTRNHKLDVPRLIAEEDRLKRAVALQEEIFTTLSKQLELAKIKVQENRALLRVLEEPTSLRTGPKRLRMVIMALFAGMALFGLRVYLRERWAQMDRNDPDVDLFLNQKDAIQLDLRALWRALLAIPKNLLGLVTRTRRT